MEKNDSETDRADERNKVHIKLTFAAISLNPPVMKVIYKC